MANKYCNLVGTNKIKNEYTKINDGFATVEADNTATNAKVASHVAGTADKHKAEDITLASARPSLTAANVKAGLEQIDIRVDNIIAGGSATKDAEVVDARYSTKHGVYNTVKARLDGIDTFLDEFDCGFFL